MLSSKHDEQYKKYKIEKTSLIPPIIYTYWHEKTLPTIVTKCIQSWKRFHPNYTIHVLHPDNVSKFIDIDIFNIPVSAHALRSDFIRLALLEKTGGIWLDASVYLNQSLDWVHSYQKKESSECVAFKINKHTLLLQNVDEGNYNIESWFLASIPNSTFIHDWNQELQRIKEFDSIHSYISHQSKIIDISHIYNPTYFVVYVSLQSILKNKKKYKLSLLHGSGPMLSCLYFFNKPTIIKYVNAFRTCYESIGISNFL